MNGNDTVNGIIDEFGESHDSLLFRLIANAVLTVETIAATRNENRKKNQKLQGEKERGVGGKAR